MLIPKLLLFEPFVKDAWPFISQSCSRRTSLLNWTDPNQVAGRRPNPTILSCPQFSSVAQSCLTLCDPMDCRMPGLPVHHRLLESTQTHVHWVSDGIQPSHPLSPPFSPIFNLSQYQGLFKWVSFSHQVAKILEFQLQNLSFQWIFRADFL